MYSSPAEDDSLAHPGLLGLSRISHLGLRRRAQGALASRPVAVISAAACFETLLTLRRARRAHSVAPEQGLLPPGRHHLRVQGHCPQWRRLQGDWQVQPREGHLCCCKRLSTIAPNGCPTVQAGMTGPSQTLTCPRDRLRENTPTSLLVLNPNTAKPKPMEGNLRQSGLGRRRHLRHHHLHPHGSGGGHSPRYKCRESWAAAQAGPLASLPIANPARITALHSC